MNLYAGSDNLLRITGLVNSRATPPTLINTATVTAAVTDIATGAQAGSTVTLTQDTGTDGQYSGTLPASAGLVSGKRYLVVVTVVVAGATLTIERTVLCADYAGSGACGCS